MAHTSAQGHDEAVYHPVDTIGKTITSTAITGGAGLFLSTVQNTLTKQNVGALGIFTRTGGTIGTFAAMGGAFEFTKCASANLRQKNDTLNTTLGGFMSGAMMGLSFRSAPAVFGYGAGFAVILTAYDYTGGSFSGYKADPDVDEVSRKEYMRKNRRRPIEETINELGESSAIHAPGYEQRRAERIKQKYGIDVPVRSSLESSS